MRIFIIGYKSSGKTTLGRQLADHLGLGFIDLDEVIERLEGKSIPDLYSEEGEEEFRKIEWLTLKKIIKKDDIVVATGGGAPCNCDNMELMEKYGDVLYLKVDDEILLNRLKKLTGVRPIIKNKSDEELREYINDLKKRCEHHYQRAKYTINANNSNVKDIADLFI